MDLVFESVDIMKRLVEGVTAALASDGLRDRRKPRLAGLMTRLVAATDTKRAAPAPRRATPAPSRSRAAAAPKQPGTGFIPLGKLKKPAPLRPPSLRAAPVAAAPVRRATPRRRRTARRQAPQDQGSHARRRRAARPPDRHHRRAGHRRVDGQPERPSPRTNLSVKLAKDLDHLDKISRELQEIGMSLRMMPVRPVFQKMARLVRDLAEEDRIARSSSSMTRRGHRTGQERRRPHRRSAGAHGPQRRRPRHRGHPPRPAARPASPRSGRIELHAFHKGGSIVIEIKDDGKGLDRAAHPAKAYRARPAARGRGAAATATSTTSSSSPASRRPRQVTDISGRGVGMDVVRRNVEELRGTVRDPVRARQGLRSSASSCRSPWRSSRAWSSAVGQRALHHPDAVGGAAGAAAGATTSRRSSTAARCSPSPTSHLPLVRLHRLFNLPDARTVPTDAVVVVVEDEGTRARRPGRRPARASSRSSSRASASRCRTRRASRAAAIMANGNVALILDVAGLNRLARSSNLTAS